MEEPRREWPSITIKAYGQEHVIVMFGKHHRDRKAVDQDRELGAEVLRLLDEMMAAGSTNSGEV
jgi:hypothetical protein